MARPAGRLAALLSVLAVGACAAAAAPRHPALAGFDPAAARPFSGVAVVAEGDDIVYSHASGFADRERSVPLTAASRFVVGSVAKQVTAALVLLQVERGTLDLDAPAAGYLPPGGAPLAPAVKVRHLLAHTSGIVARDRPPATVPGSTFAYSNLGYDLLGEIVERVTGETFGAAAARLFRACGMSRTAVFGKAGDPGPVAGFEEDADGRLLPVEPAAEWEHGPSAGIVSTAGDLVRWNLCLHGGRVLSPAGYAAMTAASAARPHRWGTLGYGFGLQLSSEDGIVELSHGGYVPGFVATLAYYPASGSTLVVLENVSWRADDMARAFAPHDALREVVRAGLRGSRPAEMRRGAGAHVPQRVWQTSDKGGYP